MRGEATGRVLQVLGLVVLPVAVWYGEARGDLSGEVLLAAVGAGLLLLGGRLRTRAG